MHEQINLETANPHGVIGVIRYPVITQGLNTCILYFKALIIALHCIIFYVLHFFKILVYSYPAVAL